MDEPPQEELKQPHIDAGMAEGGRLAAIERRVLHVDRTTEEIEARLKIVDSQTLTLIIMVATLGAMVYLLSRQVKGALK